MSVVIDPDAKLFAKDPQASLSSEESFVWSRVGSGIRVQDLLALCPWPKEQSLQLLEELLKKACIEYQTDLPPEILKQLEKDETNNIGKILDRNFRTEVWQRLKKAKSDNPFEILDLKVTATDHEVKQNYLGLSRRFHPDRFFRKDLGEYKKLLNQLFTSIQKAYEKVKNTYDREAVLRMMKAKKSDCKKIATNLAKESKQKKLDPELEKIGRAEQLFQDGLKAQDQQNYLDASQCFLRAAQLNSDKEIYQQSYEKIRPYVEKIKSKDLLKKAEEAQHAGSHEEALVYAEQAFRCDSQLFKAAILVGQTIVNLKLDDRYPDALEFLRRAKAGMAKDPNPCIQLGRLYQAMKETSKAKAEWNEALRRDPKNPRAEKLLSK